MKKTFFLLLFLQFCISFQAPEPPPPKQIVLGDYSYAIQRAEWRAEKTYKEANLQGLTFAVINESETLLTKAFGKASSQTKISLETKFYIGSVSKVFTALLTLKLVEEGKLSLDKPITFYLKNLKLIPRNSNDPPPTIRQILYHHSGLPSDEFYGFVNNKTVVLSNPKLFHSILEKPIYMADVPGKVMSYSNLGYSLLGILIEQTSKKSIEEYAKEKLFTPLEMQNTSYYYKEDESDFSKGFYGSKEIEAMYIRDLP
ncbi:MAG: beta-lactamase family protein, partial [Leptospiraceae bacterium]|nr:beta-lactamase family protein [Leptospiraceae bacterium]